jgi:serine/threonine protein kinase
MLVMDKLDYNLREYLQQNHNKLTWERRMNIIKDIVYAFSKIHEENSIHRDLHSGNILYSQINQVFDVGDLGFCGPIDKPLNSIYGNLPYIAPEVIAKMEYSFASDVYSIGMLMWEISSGQPPFFYKHDYDLAIKIINGMRPRIIPGTPLEYRELMEQCWDADPTKRPDIDTLLDEINNIYRSYLQNENVEQWTNNITNINSGYSMSSTSIINSFFRNFSSKIYYFEDMPKPRNATKGKKKNYLLRLINIIIIIHLIY